MMYLTRTFADLREMQLVLSAGVRAADAAVPVPACLVACANYYRSLGLQIQNRLGETALDFLCVRD